MKLSVSRCIAMPTDLVLTATRKLSVCMIDKFQFIAHTGGHHEIYLLSALRHKNNPERNRR